MSGSMVHGLLHLPTGGLKRQSIFRANQITGANSWQEWRKPKGCALIGIWMLSAGGGGGNGFSRAANNPGGGGGGGAGGGKTGVLLDAMLCPDILFIQVGNGGAANTAGGSTIVSSVPAATQGLYLAQYTGGGGGGNGSAGSSGSAGSGGALTSGVVNFGGLASQGSISAVGAAGGVQTGANGQSITIANNTTCNGGAGGAGCTTTDFNGGDQTSPNTLYVPTLFGGIGGGGINAGAAGIQYRGLWQFTGGTGGGSNNSGTAGNGGNGALGSGGGGGGAGTTGGTGGRGGDGIVIITAI